MSDPGGHGIQHRLLFPATSRPLTVDAYLTGRLVALSTAGDQTAELAGHLDALGVAARPHDTHGHTITPARLHRLTELPTNVTITADLELDPLWQLARRYGTGLLDTPATLTLRRTRLHLNWESADGDVVDGYLSDDATGALLHSSLPFTATADAWRAALGATRLPVTAGTVDIDPGGYLRIDATHPHQVEAAPIPGLWKIDQRHYGAPLPYLDHIRSVGGLTWPRTTPPANGRPVLRLATAELDDHVQLGADELARRLHHIGSSVVAWPGGSGRRLVVLTALAAAEALPTVIISPAAHVWAWLVALKTLGLDDSQARIVTWADLAGGAALHATPSVVFDEFTSNAAPVADGPGGAPAALRRLDHLDGLLRVGVTTTWPDEAADRCVAMRLIRPEEFSGDRETILLRYPLWPRRRADEHTSAYLLPPPALTGSRPMRRRLSVHTVPATAKQQIAEGELSERHDLTPGERHHRRQEIATVGTAEETSPKIAAVIDRLRRRPPDTHAEVIISSSRGQRLLRGLLRGDTRVTVRGWEPAVDEVPQPPPALSVVCQYPPRAELLHDLLDRDGVVVVVHLTGSIDDETAPATARAGD